MFAVQRGITSTSIMKPGAGCPCPPELRGTLTCVFKPTQRACVAADVVYGPSFQKLTLHELMAGPDPSLRSHRCSAGDQMLQAWRWHSQLERAHCLRRAPRWPTNRSL